MYSRLQISANLHKLNRKVQTHPHFQAKAIQQPAPFLSTFPSGAIVITIRHVQRTTIKINLEP